MTCGTCEFRAGDVCQGFDDVSKRLRVTITMESYPHCGKYVDEADRSYRTSGEMVCLACGQEYWRHPFTLHRFDGNPFLHRLCNGDIVKL